MYNSHKSFGEACSFTNKTIIFSYLLIMNASHTIQQRWPHLSPPLQFYLSFSSTLSPSHQAPYPTPSPISNSPHQRGRERAFKPRGCGREGLMALDLTDLLQTRALTCVRLCFSYKHKFPKDVCKKYPGVQVMQ